ncbi:MAG TPA: phosphatase PAP2 family protein [Solirubrobacteraceae bacterium]|nr:phosphatase PAP2 family protein [Solirubrobacteraceae bacterium]
MDPGKQSSTLTASPDASEVSRRSVFAGPVIAAVTVVAALLATHEAGVPFTDPDHVGARRLFLVCCLVAVLVVLDISLRAVRASDRRFPSLSELRTVRRERWTRHRGIAAISALVSFYVTYVAYRNLKSVVPLLRPGDLFDRELADLDRALFGGTDPAELLHTVLGTGISTQILSTVYVTFVFFLPLSLAIALVFSPDLQGGIYYATALSVNWLIGAGSYFLIPARGPIYYVPGDFAALPDSHASYLQGLLLDQRRAFLADPTAPGAAQNIAAFASLHCSLLFTAALAAHHIGLGRRVRITLWALFVLSAISTVHLGWHYVLDDVAGILIGLAALAIAKLLTGFEPRNKRARTAPAPSSLKPATGQPPLSQ